MFKKLNPSYIFSWNANWKTKLIKRGYQICQLYKSEVIFAKSHYERTLFSEAIIVSLQILNSKKFEILAQ